MASSEHKNLATFIKSIHSNLRKESQVYGAEEAWKRHVAQRDTLKKYATSMRELATKHWAENVADPTKTTRCRIDWVRARCLEYFSRGGKEFYRRKESSIRQRMMNTERTDDITENNPVSNREDTSLSLIETRGKTLESQSDEGGARRSGERFERSENRGRRGTENALNSDQPDEIEISSKINLLDVGSCYNPFGEMEFFNVTAVDLAPSCDEVLQCDFLSVKEGRENMFAEYPKQAIQLAVDSFDAVVFCLLLEYMPSPEQRHACCAKAYNLLNDGGLLFIITPDSKHVGANANVMKSWRFVLSKLGFMRIKYEKLPHAHCMAFRKCVHKEVATRWADLQKFSKDDALFRSESEMFIPQDFREDVIEARKPREERGEVNSDDRENVAEVFNELPLYVM